MTIRYALVSQRGYYPESPDKPNQDAVCAYQNFGNDPEQLFFGVFDGHGNYGTSTAQFAKDKVRAAGYRRTLREWLKFKHSAFRVLCQLK